MNPGAASWEGKGVTLGAIEQQLHRLWSASDSEWQGDGRRPDIRTSVLNLIVYAGDDAVVERACAAIDHLSGTHPSRALIVVPNTGQKTSAVDARISIKSHGAYAEYRQVCSEQLTLWIHGPAAHHISSVVLPLLAPDLPVFLWWPGEAPFRRHLFEQLREAADRLLVDSNDFGQPLEDLPDMSRAVKAGRGRCAISDFNWARLAPWRERIAQFFDLPESRPYLDALDRVSIEYGDGTDGTYTLAQALLLGGWLSASLGLTPSPARAAEGRLAVDLRARGGGTLSLEIAPRSSRTERCAQLRLLARSQLEPAEFSLSHDGASGQVFAAMRLAGRPPVVRQTVFEARDDGALLFGDLEMFHHDPAYEEALRMAAAMVSSGEQAYRVRGSIVD